MNYSKNLIFKVVLQYVSSAVHILSCHPFLGILTSLQNIRYNCYVSLSVGMHVTSHESPSESR